MNFGIPIGTSEVEVEALVHWPDTRPGFHFHRTSTHRRPDGAESVVHPRVALFHFQILLSLGLPFTSVAVPEFTAPTMGMQVPSPLATQRIASRIEKTFTADVLVSTHTTVCDPTS